MSLVLDLGHPSTAIARAGLAPAEVEPRGLARLLFEAQQHLAGGGAATAERRLRRALQVAPGHPDVLNLLGVARGRLGHAAEGEALARRALRGRPDNAAYLHNLALRLLEQNRAEEALEALTRAHRLAPADPGVVRVLARTLGRMERWDEALAVAARAPACRPEEPLTLVTAGKVLALGGRLKDAVPLFERAVELAPDRVDWWLDFARLCHRIERVDDAATALEKVLAAAPDHAEARTMLASILLRRRDYRRLEEVLSGLTASGTDAANAVNLTAMMLVAQAKVEEGLEAMALVDEIAPDAHELQMTRVMYRNYDPTIGRDELFEVHRAFGARFGGHVPRLAGDFDLARDPERRLRIGYVSPDFRAHSVAYFVAPILEAHHRERFEVIAFAHLNRPDHVSEHLRVRVDAWHDVTALDDRALARRIRDERIDVLVDLAGLTANSRLLAFTGRPAPVQVSYLGYPNTTGLPQIDYRITDHVADPAGADELHTETLIRLPRCFLCYAIPEHAPAVAPPPLERNRHVTFGSFNSLNKVNRQVVALWARVLAAVPGSRLLLKAQATADPKARAQLLEGFGEHGISPERLELVAYAEGLAEHLDVYGRVDVALDTFPYNGTTTTCEALWMGVPVITLAGDRHPARVGASLLSSIGFQAGIAASPDEYVGTARLMADHPDLIRAARRGLRADLARSPLCDMHGHARALEAAYREVFRMWCAGEAEDRP